MFENCGRTKAATLMQLANVAAKRKKKFKATTDSKHKLSWVETLDRQQQSSTLVDRRYTEN